MHRHFVLLADGRANRGRNLLHIQTIDGIARNFLGHDEQLAAWIVDGESGSTSRTQRGMARFDREFDVLGIIVDPANDDEIFETPRNEKFAVLQEPEIAGAEVVAFTVVRKGSPEGGGRLVGTVPIARRNAGSFHPNLADFAIGAEPTSIGSDNPNILIGCRRTAAHKRPRPCVVFRELAYRDLAAATRERYRKRGFGKTVTGKKRVAPESGALELLRKGIQCARPNRFGAVKRHAPCAQVQRVSFVIANLVDTKLIGKIRPAADSRAPLAQGLQPRGGLFQEVQGRHKRRIAANERRNQHARQQSHVMELGQPTEHMIVRA